MHPAFQLYTLVKVLGVNTFHIRVDCFEISEMAIPPTSVFYILIHHIYKYHMIELFPCHSAAGTVGLVLVTHIETDPNLEARSINAAR